MIFQKSFKPVETLILLLILIYCDSIIPARLDENLLGEANIIYAAYIFIKFLVGVLYKKDVILIFFSLCFKVLQKQSFFLSYFLVNYVIQFFQLLL